MNTHQTLLAIDCLLQKLHILLDSNAHCKYEASDTRLAAGLLRKGWNLIAGKTPINATLPVEVHADADINSECILNYPCQMKITDHQISIHSDGIALYTLISIACVLTSGGTALTTGRYYGKQESNPMPGNPDDILRSYLELFRRTDRLNHNVQATLCQETIQGTPRKRMNVRIRYEDIHSTPPEQYYYNLKFNLKPGLPQPYDVDTDERVTPCCPITVSKPSNPATGFRRSPAGRSLPVEVYDDDTSDTHNLECECKMGIAGDEITIHVDNTILNRILKVRCIRTLGVHRFRTPPSYHGEQNEMDGEPVALITNFLTSLSSHTDQEYLVTAEPYQTGEDVPKKHMNVNIHYDDTSSNPPCRYHYSLIFALAAGLKPPFDQLHN